MSGDVHFVVGRPSRHHVRRALRPGQRHLDGGAGAHGGRVICVHVGVSTGDLAELLDEVGGPQRVECRREHGALRQARSEGPASAEGISIATSAGPQCGRGVPGETRRAAAEDLLRELPGAEQATWIWSDGSATGGVPSGGGGALVVLPSGDMLEVRTPAGIYCSSTRAEMIALRDALSKVAENEDAGPTEESPIIACLDSQAALATLESGPAAQSTHLGADVWRLLLRLAERGRPVHLQWVPAHCGVAGNERADEIAKEAANLDQSEAPIDTRSATRAAARAARQAWQLAWPDGW